MGISRILQEIAEGDAQLGSHSQHTNFQKLVIQKSRAPSKVNFYLTINLGNPALSFKIKLQNWCELINREPKQMNKIKGSFGFT